MRISESRQPRTIGPRIGIASRGDDPRNAGTYEKVRTGGTACRSVRTRFQGHIGSCACRAMTRLVQRHGFGMGASARLCPAAPDHPIISHDDTTDRRICACLAASTGRKR